MTASDYIPRPVRPAVLLYHRIARGGDPADPCAVPAHRFEEQVRRLAGERRGGGAPARRSPRAVVTFDDGYLDVYDTAFPILQRHGLAATVFVVSGHVGRASGRWGPPTPAPMMTWSQLEELSRHGFSIQSHTRTHPDLTRCGDADAAGELGGSRAEIEERVGARVDEIAYPFGRFDARIIALAARAGYRRGWAAGLAPPGPFSLERFQITGRDTPRTFALKASGWGAWVRRLAQGVRPRGIRTGRPVEAYAPGGTP
jgi:peptidoglycan/xylan/chitin deacetylase (PgdA/CDA1 family)